MVLFRHGMVFLGVRSGQVLDLRSGQEMSLVVLTDGAYRLFNRKIDKDRVPWVSKVGK